MHPESVSSSRPLTGILLYFTFLFLIFTGKLHAQTGIVLEQTTNNPIEHARVQRISDGMIVFTGSDGKFDFSATSAASGPRHTTKSLPVSFHRNRVSLHVTKTNTPVRIRLFTTGGRKIADIANGISSPGTQSFALPVTGQNLLIVSITCGAVTINRSLITTPAGGSFTWTGNPVMNHTTVADAQPTDTLITSKYGYITSQNITPTNEIVLSPYPADAIIPPGMKPIPGGTFMMGSIKDSSDHGRRLEYPVHQVTLSPFFMDSTEVTQTDYFSLMGKSPWESYDDLHHGTTGPYHPTWNIGWYEAVIYCNERSKRDGLDTIYTYSEIRKPWTHIENLKEIAADYSKNGYRLPTEAEWEYAARAETDTRYYWGEDTSFATIDQYAWYGEHGRNRNWPVAQKTPNDFDLYDILGNVSEYTAEFPIAYSDKAQTDPVGIITGGEKIIRGGDWTSNKFSITLFRRQTTYNGRFDDPTGTGLSGTWAAGIRCVLRKQ